MHSRRQTPPAGRPPWMQIPPPGCRLPSWMQTPARQTLGCRPPPPRRKWQIRVKTLPWPKLRLRAVTNRSVLRRRHYPCAEGLSVPKLNYLPNTGVWLDVWGILSDTISMKTVKERSTVILNETFSPASGGMQNTSRMNNDNIMHGRSIFSM